MEAETYQSYFAHGSKMVIKGQGSVLSLQADRGNINIFYIQAHT